jgi:TetR/AcrR family transcriptional repressor of bet genes
MPKAVDSEERRHELTDAAARVIARSGIAAATMREVAAEAGWTTGTLTHYFTDKHDLLLRTFQASLEGRRAQRPERELVSPDATLRLSLARALPLDEDTRRHWMVTIACCSQASGDPELAVAQRDAYRDHRAHVTALVGRSTGEQGADAEGTAERLIALTDGIALQALFDPESWPPRRQLAALDEALATLPTPV